MIEEPLTAYSEPIGPQWHEGPPFQWKEGRAARAEAAFQKARDATISWLPHAGHKGKHFHSLHIALLASLREHHSFNPGRAFSHPDDAEEDLETYQLTRTGELKW
eukprot:292702-Pelagomonas_calceolata.AAC.3